ncbi:MAG: SelB C-terminal domain-containing protein, partial [candidate division Zixibacteria bacterium]|nr:SelB C-terminal domain-containing protein [candidate division Zixibacteria bacterium]
LRGGALATGRTVSIWPAMTTARIRSLRANNCDVEKALPGQRTAVSLTGVDKNLLVRGGVISDRLNLSFFEKHPVLALSIEMLAEAPVSLTNRRQALLITGTTEIQGEIRLVDQKQIAPSHSGIVFFKPEQPVFALVGDHYILRLPTPMVTLGGGRILDHLEHVPRRKQIAGYDYLEERLSWKLNDIVTTELKKRVAVQLDRLLNEAAVSSAQVRTTVNEMVTCGKLSIFNGFVVHKDSFEAAVRVFKTAMAGFLDSRPHLKGMSRDELLRLSSHNTETADVILDYLVSEGAVVRLRDKYNLTGRGMSLKGNIKTAYNQLMKMLREQSMTPPKLSKLAEGGRDYREAIKYIVESGEGYKCGSDFIFLSDTWDEIVSFIREQIKTSDKLAVANLKEKFGMTRKYTIPILEETDRIGLTRRDGDLRLRGDNFEK